MFLEEAARGFLVEDGAEVLVKPGLERSGGVVALCGRLRVEPRKTVLGFDQRAIKPAHRGGIGARVTSVETKRLTRGLEADAVVVETPGAEERGDFLSDLFFGGVAPGIDGGVDAGGFVLEIELERVAQLEEGEKLVAGGREGVEFEFPYDKTTFKDRYTRQHRQRACSTIVAHLAKDGLMFIHPTQNRSLTPREAARVQSFPDWFVFPEARTHAFRLIGNAVPPLVGEAVGDAIRAFLPLVEKPNGKKTSPVSTLDLPRDASGAARRLNRLMTCTHTDLRVLPMSEFVSGWHALLWLFPGLHPDNACDHGNDQHPWPESRRLFPDLSPEKRAIFTRTGWPVALELIGVEAWRRYDAEEISDEVFYCSAAQQAGLAAHRLSSGHKASFL